MLRITSSDQAFNVLRVHVEGLIQTLESLDLVVGLEVFDAQVYVLEGPLAVLCFAHDRRVVLGREVS